MKTVQMTLDDDLVEEVDRAVRQLWTTRSAFTRDALWAALQRRREAELEQRHRRGAPAAPCQRYRIQRRGWLDLTEDQEALLEVVTRFNIEARYPDYKGRFRKKATLEFTAHHLDRIHEARKRLLKLIET